MRVEQTSLATVTDFWQDVQPGIEPSQCLEEAAQVLAEAVHGEFSESVVLNRIFLTVPFDSLPAPNRAFVQNLAESAGAAAELKETTPVLSLIGTCGQEKDWCDRRSSRGHVGIPLISSAFVGAIPMISRLLKEFGIPMDFLQTHDSDLVIETIGRKAGLFFVSDASEAVDQEGRKIIAAQDFVSEYHVRSVFGIGGAYAGGQMLVLVVFCRDEFMRAKAEEFLTLVDRFRSHTEGLVSGGRVFADR